MNLKSNTKKREYAFKLGNWPLGLAFLALLSSTSVFAENGSELKTGVTVTQQNSRTVSGIVKDATGETIIGANVSVKGTTTGTITDIDGKFSLNVPAGSTLKISYIGYQDFETVITTQSTLDVVLKVDSKTLDEVVVVGFGSQKKVNVTGAVSMVGSEVIESRPVQNVSQALQGVVPGLNFSVNTSGGALDNSLNVNIRGAGTIGSGSNSSPLVLIDGVEGNMNAINPQDIESISVLKDAASASIYGARAAFGVILINTKSGKSGRTNVNYSGNVRFTDALAVPDMLDSYKFAQYFNEAAKNSGQGAVFSETQMQRILAYQKGEITDGATINTTNNRWNNYTGANANTDWFKEMYKDWVPSHEHNLSVSGGNEKVTYLVSGNFLDQNGLIAHGKDKFNRYTLNGKINATLSDYVKLNYSSKWIREDYKRPSYMTGLFFHNIARRWPTNPVYDPNGYYMEGNEIIQMEDGGIQKNQKDYAYQQLQLVIEPIKDWKIYAEGNLNTITNFQHWEVLPVYAHDVNGDQYAFSWDGRAVGSTTVNEYGYKENFMTTNIYSDYFKQFDNGHFIKVMGGFNAEVMKTRSLSAQGDGLITPSVPTVNTTTTNPSVGGGYAHWSTAGFFGRLNYNYKERYLVEANVRYDGTSRFVGDERWGVFPSFSLGWNIAREDFFADYTDKVSTLKLRGSWGQLGNMNTKLWYPFYQSMSVGTNNGYWLVDGEKTNTAYAPGIVSSLMTWETIESWNLGLDWGAFNNRLTGTFDYFKRSTKDMVGPAPELSSVLGTGVPKINNSDMESYGFELEVSWRDRIGDLSYGVKAVVSDAQQKVTRYPNKSNSLSTWYSGRMNGDIWGYTTLGIAKTQEEMDAHLAKVNQSRLGNQWGAGDIMYADLNGDGEISNGANTLADHGDLKIIGNNTPRYNYGITLDAAYKGFDFSVFFQGIGKRDYWVSGAYFWGATGGMWQSAGFTEHWDFFRGEDNPLGANLNAYYPRPLFTSGKNMQTQSRYLQDASYLRMKNIQLGYTLPKSITSKAGMQSVRVYVSGDNLATISSMSKIFDPETIGGAWGDGKLYPLSKTISVGLNVNF